MSFNYSKFIEDNLAIVDKTGHLVPFRLNSVQSRFLISDYSEKCIILKARQQGFSSLVLAVFMSDFLMVENSYNVVVADDEDNAEGLLKRVKDYLKYYEAKNEVTIPLKYNSKYHLFFEGRNSTYIIGTAKNTQFGRSKTITNLHLSEVAFYPHLDEIIAGAVQAVSGRVIMETTANGFNPFKSYWERSKVGETGFKPLFYKASDFYEKDFLLEKKKQLGDKFAQEYPENDIECFITSGRGYFDPYSLQEYLKNVKEPIEPFLIGRRV